MRRDRFSLGMMIGIPAIQLMLFGFAIQTGVRHLPTVVLDEARSSESRALVAAIEQTGNFTIVDHVASQAEMAARIREGSAHAAVVIPPDFTRDLKRARTATAQVIVDAADPLASASAISGAALAGFARSRELERLAGQLPPPIDVRVRPWYNPTLRSAVYIVPGIIGVLLSLTMLLITSMAVVRERERGTLLSGFMFPREAMPALAQWLGALLPLTYFLAVLRGILLKGVGIEGLWWETLVLAGFSVLFVMLSVRRFRKRIE